MAASGDIDVTRREFETYSHKTDNHGEQLAVLGEWKKHRDQSLDGIFTTLRRIEDALAPIVKVQEQQAVGLLNQENRLTRQEQRGDQQAKEISEMKDVINKLVTQIETTEAVATRNRSFLLAICSVIGLIIAALTFLGFRHQ